jgi:hypothetical protein
VPVANTSGVEHVIASLVARRDALIDQVVAEARLIGGYVTLSDMQQEDFVATVQHGFDVVLGAMSEARPLRRDDVAFLWPHIRRRTQAGVPEGDMLAVVRVFQRTLWDAISELAGSSDEGRAAALTLARPLLTYIDALSAAVDAAFVEADQARAWRAQGERRALLESLLAGESASWSGLRENEPFVVISARPIGARADDGSLEVVCAAMVKAAGAASSSEALAAVRAGEVVLLQAAAAALAPSLADAVRRLDQRGIPVALGVSTDHADLGRAPAAYREARLAGERVGDRAGVVALGELTVADYLILRGGDRTAWRLVPPDVRRFVEEDADAGGALSETLLAYVECDLNVKLAAERLFVHPNTAHYRLARIEERTGCDVRRLADVLAIVIAIRLHRAMRGQLIE